jgi:hypothetical protein
MLNVRYLLVSKSDPVAAALLRQPDRFRLAFTASRTDVIENLRATQRAFVIPASGIEVIAREPEQLTRLKESTFDPERSVILTEAHGISSDSRESAVRTRVDWMDRNSNAFKLKASTPGDGVLVVSQIYYPGWKATIDGVIVPVVSANFALTAVFLPAGTHDVRFFYDPASFKIGAIVSAVSLALLAMLCLSGAAWWRRSRGSAP